MARGLFQKTFTYADTEEATGLPIIRPLDDVSVEVRLPGTITKVQTYGSANPNDLTPLPNPIVTGDDGLVEFFTEWADVDIFYHDNAVQPRVGDRTFGPVAIVSGADRGAPSRAIAADGQLQYNSLDSTSKRQDAPLGTVLDWWRPNASYNAGAGAGMPPPGFEVCDGGTILQANHDFGPIGNIVLPDLRNAFVLGADIGKGDGTVALGDDTVAGGPGIRGAGGSQRHLLLAGQSGLPVHPHSDNIAVVDGVAPDHVHGPPFAPGSYVVATQAGFAQVNLGSGASLAVRFADANSGLSGVLPHGHGKSGGVINNAAQDASAYHNNTPRYVGLLKIMKVRRA